MICARLRRLGVSVLAVRRKRMGLWLDFFFCRGVFSQETMLPLGSPVRPAPHELELSIPSDTVRPRAARFAHWL